MKRFLLLLLILLIPKADAYVSPENYAVNEADLTDYRMIAPSPKLDIDSLDDSRFQAPNIVEKDISIGEETQSKTKKSKKQSDEITQNQTGNTQVKKGVIYKIAKWWVDERYKREEPHHGALHEIKVQKRMEYELRQMEAQKAKAAETAAEAERPAVFENTDNFDTQHYAPNPALFI